MTTLTMRMIKGDFVVTGPDVEPMKFKSRREAQGLVRPAASGLTRLKRSAAAVNGRRSSGPKLGGVNCDPCRNAGQRHCNAAQGYLGAPVMAITVAAPLVSYLSHTP